MATLEIERADSLQVRQVLNEENKNIKTLLYRSFYYSLFTNGHIYFIDSFWQVRKEICH